MLPAPGSPFVGTPLSVVSRVSPFPDNPIVASADQPLPPSGHSPFSCVLKVQSDESWHSLTSFTPAATCLKSAERSAYGGTSFRLQSSTPTATAQSMPAPIGIPASISTP